MAHPVAADGHAGPARRARLRSRASSAASAALLVVSLWLQHPLRRWSRSPWTSACSRDGWCSRGCSSRGQSPANFEVVLGLRPAGFFINTTALSVFGVVCLCYFYAHYVANRRARGPVATRWLSLFVILLTTSRAAFVGRRADPRDRLVRVDGPRKLKLVVDPARQPWPPCSRIEETLGLDQAFYRFTRVRRAACSPTCPSGSESSTPGPRHSPWRATTRSARSFPPHGSRR